MLNYFSAAIGGALGTVIRLFIGNHMSSRLAAKWPMATMIVNLLGCFLIGWLAVYFERTDGPKWLQVGLIAGLCGGMTTFSAFIFELTDLIQSGLQLRFWMYLAASIFLGLAAIYIGMRVASA